VKTSRNILARFHALWTLEGLNALQPALVRQLMEDPEPRMRIQAIRASETLYKAGDKSFASDYKALTKDPDVNVVIQAMLTLNRWKVADAGASIKEVMDSNQARGVQVVASTVLNPPAGRGGPPLTPEQQSIIERGATIYNEVCFACHAPDGLGTPKPELATTMAPPLAGSPRVNGHRDYAIKAVLHGLSGPIDGKTYTDVMMPMGVNNDEWVAAVASYVRRSFGNTGGFVTPADVARVRSVTADRKTMWTIPELTASLPPRLSADGWKATASHNLEDAIGGLRLTTWSSGASQEAGMWFQIELPRSETITEMQFQSPPAGDRGAAVSTGGSPVSTPAGPGFPRGWRVDVSLDGASWKAVAEGKGSEPGTTITFQPIVAKFVRITLTASVENGPAWSIQNLRLYAAPGP
jgi:mono/diheme cytochrome c family protein